MKTINCKKAALAPQAKLVGNWSVDSRNLPFSTSPRSTVVKQESASFSFVPISRAPGDREGVYRVCTVGLRA